MKPKKVGKKLALSKTTIVNLEQKEQGAVKGGYWATEINTGCTSWHPICFSKPEWKCPVSVLIRRCPEPISEEIC